MKTIKRILPLLFILVISCAARATIIWEDATNYPYTNGCIEGQGQWVCYSYPSYLDALVTNNVLLLYSNHLDAVEAPTTNGWVNPNPSGLIYAGFRIMVTQLPESEGDFFCEFHDSYPAGNTNAAGIGHVFIDKLGTTVPGTYRLGIANYATEFDGADAAAPPINYPQDLATDIWYDVVIAYGGNGVNIDYQGATLWINPSEQDYTNFINVDSYNENTDTNGVGNYVYGNDTQDESAQQGNIINGITPISDILFSPGDYKGSEGITNVIAGTAFADVLTTNLPVIGIQPYLFSTNYSGQTETFYTVASGVDLAYQWYSLNYGALTDGMTFANGDSFIGSTSNTLVVTNLEVSDTYYCKVTDYYGNTATCSNAFLYVNTTPTAPFFTNSAVSLTTNLFTYADFYAKAFGSGPITYQWYFAPTNQPITYSPLVGSNSDNIDLYLADFTGQGTYYVVASNSVGGGSVAVSPTNTLIELAPTVASILQLHQLYWAVVTETPNPINANPGSTYYFGSANVTVGGYVTSYSLPVPGAQWGGGMGNSYSEFYIQDTNGNGVQVYLGGVNNTNTPPIGTYVTVAGQYEAYNGEPELAPSSLSAVTIVSNAPPYTITPRPFNSLFNQVVTNLFGSNTVFSSCEMVSFTNCFLYGSPQGLPFGANGQYYGFGGTFSTNHYTHLYFTVGTPYNPSNALNTAVVNPAYPWNTNTLSIYQFGYDYPYNEGTILVHNPFDGLIIQTNYYEITGALLPYESTANSPSGEILPSRVADYVISPPTNTTPPFKASVAETNLTPTVTWAPNVGSTYSVYSATNILGPWTQAAYGLAYYPTNGAFTDTKTAKAKFYYITSP